MSTTFACSACRGTIAADGVAGTQVRCPLCGAVVTVPPLQAPPTVAGPIAPPGQPPRQGMAVASLICGIGGLVTCGLSGLVGIVLGVVALTRANREPQRYGGSGVAVAGICTGAFSLIVLPLLMISILLPSLTRARELSKRLVCGANLKSLGTSFKIYASASLGTTPSFETLVEAGEITEKQLWCPSSGAVLGDLRACYEVIPDAVVLRGRGDAVLAYDKPENHGGEGANVLFTDGHVEFIRGLEEVDRRIAETKRLIAEAQKEAADTAEVADHP